MITSRRTGMYVGGRWLESIVREPVEPAFVIERPRRNTVELAIEQVSAGRPVVVVHDGDAAGSGEIVFAASLASTDVVAFVVRHSSGYLRVALPESRANELDLPLMAGTVIRDGVQACTVTVDAAEGITTGISAADRAQTIKLLAMPNTARDQLSRPGHVQPVLAEARGVLGRAAVAEAALDLAYLAGQPAVGAHAALVSRDDPTQMADSGESRKFADEFDLVVVSIVDLVRYRRAHEVAVERVVAARIPLAHGRFEAVGYTSINDGMEHVALVTGEIANECNVLVRVHQECLLGDVFGSLRCECSQSLQDSLRQIEAAGRGVLVYLRRAELAAGAGGGLLGTLRSYERADRLGKIGISHRLSEADLDTATEILRDLGMQSIVLVGEGADDAFQLRRRGLGVSSSRGISMSDQWSAKRAGGIRILPSRVSRAG
jgi:3,4-dihydroxy 2-butanone 4-phosphate synthase/GTP cyclohydrolase II